MSILRRDAYATDNTPLWASNGAFVVTAQLPGISLPAVASMETFIIGTLKSDFFTEVGSAYEATLSFEAGFPMGASGTGENVNIGLYYRNAEAPGYPYTVVAQEGSTVVGTDATIFGTVTLPFIWGGGQDGVDLILANLTAVGIEEGGSFIIHSFSVRKIASADGVKPVTNILQ